jgi:hypothetical protein
LMQRACRSHPTIWFDDPPYTEAHHWRYAQDVLTAQAEIARPKLQRALGGPSSAVPRRKLARDTEQLELALDARESG